MLKSVGRIFRQPRERKTPTVSNSWVNQGAFGISQTGAFGASVETQRETTLSGKFKAYPRMPPAASLRSRFDNTPSRGDRYRSLAPITARLLVHLRFNTQATEHPGISGIDRQGEFVVIIARVTIGAGGRFGVQPAPGAAQPTDWQHCRVLHHADGCSYATRDKQASSASSPYLKARVHELRA
jgi:hypothetical protein